MPGSCRAVILADDVRVVRHSELNEWLVEGESLKVIAEWIGFTPQALHYHLKKMGWSHSQMRGWRRSS